ncbi:hypothetical protein K438DRAFT_1749675 [Mycena galopus ATCC 62051]|nr:hypothetical protein K438DRAFT_1749675 [Mycena galopus ATCC 62051]
MESFCAKPGRGDLQDEDSGSEKQSELGLTQDDGGWDGILADEPNNYDPDYEMYCQGPMVMNGLRETMFSGTLFGAPLSVWELGENKMRGLGIGMEKLKKIGPWAESNRRLPYTMLDEFLLRDDLARSTRT